MTILDTYWAVQYADKGTGEWLNTSTKHDSLAAAREDRKHYEKLTQYDTRVVRRELH